MTPATTSQIEYRRSGVGLIKNSASSAAIAESDNASGSRARTHIGSSASSSSAYK
jgi:hypothetical protein